jgi:hypothetical protein
MQLRAGHGWQLGGFRHLRLSSFRDDRLLSGFWGDGGWGLREQCFDGLRQRYVGRERSALGGRVREWGPR